MGSQAHEEIFAMKRMLKLACLCSTLLFAVAAFSAEKSVKFSSPVSLNGTTLQAGEYEVRYTVNGTNVDVQFVQGRKTVATTSAQLVEARKISRDTIITNSVSEGSPRLVSIQFANQRNAITFGETASGGSN
jgi:hypothetical protein